MPWDRNSPWRQGHILRAETVIALGIQTDGAPDKTAVVVISHDCDIAQASTTEPHVEVIVGHVIDGAPEGNYTHSKNARRLHLSCSAGETACVIELEATRRLLLEKESLDGR